MTSDPRQAPSLSQLVRDLVRDVRDLTRGELDLLKAEMRESFASLGRALVLMAVGAVLGLAAALTLLFALNHGLTALYVQWLSLEVAVWLAPLTLTLVFGALAALILRKGSAVLRDTSLAPRATQQTLREDKEWLKTRLS